MFAVWPGGLGIWGAVALAAVVGATWAGLTAGEARLLAATMLVRAAACDARPPRA